MIFLIKFLQLTKARKAKEPHSEKGKPHVVAEIEVSPSGEVIHHRVV